MALLLSCQSVTKNYSSRPLFRGINFSVDERERLGLIGPNGAGKSTLLKMLAGLESPDDGTITPRKNLSVAYVPQDEKFPHKPISEVLDAALTEKIEEHERYTRVNIIADKMGFSDPTQPADTLSGGWRKRLSLACQLIKEPDLLLLDEPTNHLDLEGVLWLEKLLLSSQFAFVLVTHDRSFLENVASRIVELNPTYADGYLSVNGKYSDFLMSREEYMGAQANLEQAIASKVRREIAWLQRGARARQTKAQGRIKEAGKLIDSLAEVKFRNSQTGSIDVDFMGSGRKTKELLVATGLQKSMGDRLLFRDVSFVLSPGIKLGLLGVNGSGKTTLLRLLTKSLEPDKGTLKTADGLRVVVFDQNREQLDQSKTLREALCPSGDSVVYRGRSVHVATWSKRFLFRPDQLPMPISYLSGGEQARILIANLMLREADILILDEQTNDLDIPSLEVLEDSLEDFPGAVVLVTHDRFMLDNVSNTILSLDGNGGARFFADYAQWEANADEPNLAPAKGRKGKSDNGKYDSKLSSAANSAAVQEKSANGLRKLSTNERKELEEIHVKIEAAEKEVVKLELKLSDSSIASNHVKLQAAMKEVDVARKAVEKLYLRWQDLEERKAIS